MKLAECPDHETIKTWTAIKVEKPHILVTAPSNAAVDGLVQRIIAEGFMDGENQRYNPPILRVGRGASDQFRGVGVLLEEQVSHLMSLGRDKVQARITERKQQLMHLDKLRHEIRHCLRSYKADFIRKHQPPPPPHAPPPLDDDGGMIVKEEIDVEKESDEDKEIVQLLLKDKMYQKIVADMTAVLEDFGRVQKEVLRYQTILSHQDDGSGSTTYGVNYELQQALEVSLVDSAHIVFSTLSSSALPVFQETTPFRVVVIDEAAQGSTILGFEKTKGSFFRRRVCMISCPSSSSIAFVSFLVVCGV